MDRNTVNHICSFLHWIEEKNAEVRGLMHQLVQVTDLLLQSHHRVRRLVKMFLDVVPEDEVEPELLATIWRTW